ncbi:MAG: hypothetical protein Q8N23_24600 [Archangium sp.]|nr:hypothetical protein [Archangium sp.]MDP3155875.1 hypothetical protein [Archangium sp.]MDP3575415.1 hypothetical protein [Archangium sp.]
MMTLCLSLALAALPPRVALMTASRVNVSERDAAALNARLAAELKDAGLVVLEVNLSCQGELACLQAQGRGVDVEAVVSVTLATGPRQIAVDVETVSVRSATSIDQRGFAWKSKQPLESAGKSIAECARGIAARVLAARPPETAEVAGDRPAKVELTPAPLAAVPVVVVTPPVSRVPEVITGGAALALGVAAAVLTGLAVDQQARLAAEPPYSLTLEQATARRDAANGTFTAAGVTGGTAGALAITSLLLFIVR